MPQKYLFIAILYVKMSRVNKALLINLFTAALHSKSVVPGVNFINILRAAFTRVGPKSAKRLSFALLGSACVKAACKTLMKITPGVRSLPLDLTHMNSQDIMKALGKKCLLENFSLYKIILAIIDQIVVNITKC